MQQSVWWGNFGTRPRREAPCVTASHAAAAISAATACASDCELMNSSAGSGSSASAGRSDLEMQAQKTARELDAPLGAAKHVMYGTWTLARIAR